MTQLSRERLEEIAELARKANYKPCAVHMTNLIAVCDSEIIEEMARRLLAVEGQEPVGEVVLGSRDDEGNYPHAHAICLAGDGCADWDNFPDGFKLYAAPQPAPVAQPVQVPGEMTIKKAAEVYFGGFGSHTAYRDGYNACRTAMLKAEPVSQPYTLPENVRESLTKALQAMEFMGDTLNNLDAVCAEDVEFVTPAFDAIRELLAAAPQEPTK